MTLIAAGGGEEQHTNTGAEFLGPHGTVANTSIDDAKFYTGTASFIYKGLAAGGSKQSAQTARGWWSYAAYLVAWDKGTHRSMWGLGSDGAGTVKLGWTKGSGVNEHKIRLTTRTGSYDSVAEFTTIQWHRVKVEFDEGVWTIWASDNGAAFAEVLSRDDSGTYQALDPMYMNVNSTTDETGAAALWLRGDDMCFWDPTGDNWNSLIGEQDFPRISEAHMPDTAGAKTESDAGQAGLLDEVPAANSDDTETNPINVSTTAGSPGTLEDSGKAWTIDEWIGFTAICNGETLVVTENTAITLTGGDWSADPGDGKGYMIVATPDVATITEDEYWTDVEDFKPGAVTIQALMVTRTDHVPAGVGATQKKFNVREGGTLYDDSAEGGDIIQWGSSTTDTWVTYAGYYPWTPLGFNWTEAIFEACQYGTALVDGETDQITVQVIYFGSSPEWVGPAVTHIRQGVALGSANPMVF